MTRPWADLFGPEPLSPSEQDAADLLWELWELGAILWIREDGAGQMADADHVTAEQRAQLKALGGEIRTCIQRLQAETDRCRNGAAPDDVVGLSGWL